jgi:hypothetical protein
MFLVVDGVEGRRYDKVDSPAFSPDGKPYCEAKQGDKWTIVLDGAEGVAYDGFPAGGGVVFEDGNRFHYLAVRGSDVLLVESTLAGKK